MKNSLFTLFGVLGFSAVSRAAFTPGNLVVLDVAGNGSANSGAITLKQFNYNGDGTFNPTPTNYALNSSAISLPGANDHDGLLRQSTDGNVLTFGAYAAPAGTTNVGSTSSSAVPRVIGVLNGNFNLSITPTAAYSTLTIRSVAATDGSHFWTSGNAGTTSLNNVANGGQFYVDGNGSTQLTALDARSSQIVKNQLWGVSSSQGAFTTGSGLPMTSGQTNTVRMTSPYAKSDAVYLDLDGNGTNDTAYTTDGKNLIGKWHSNDGLNWTITGTFDGVKTPPAGSTIFNDTNELAAYVYNGAVELLLVNQAGNLYQLPDTNGISNDFSAAFKADTSPTPIYSATDGSSFRGLVMLVPEPTSFTLLGFAGLLTGRRRRA